MTDSEETKQAIGRKPSPEKLKALQLAMEKIEKDQGKGSIMLLGDDKVEDVDVIPTGSIGLNAALGVGGYPKGRIIEIYGPESSGKTTLAIHAIAELNVKAVSLPLLMPNTLSIAFTQLLSVLISTLCSSPNQIAENRLWKLRTNSFALQLLTWS